MCPDEEGFLYPLVAENLCVNCGICNNVCPIENKPLLREGIIESYVLRTKVADILEESTSGGFITPLADYILERDGVVCAASYNENFEVKHTISRKNWGRV